MQYAPHVTGNKTIVWAATTQLLGLQPLAEMKDFELAL
jgi:hypothetical protein